LFEEVDGETPENIEKALEEKGYSREMAEKIVKYYG
jgi:hypothetical protein